MSRSIRTARRSIVLVRVASGLFVVCVVLSACGTPTGEAGATGTAPGPPLPGITSSSVTVGYTIADTGAVDPTTGLSQPDQGDVALQTAAIKAIVDYVNADGGMGGRQVVPDIKTYAAATGSLPQELALCAAFVQDRVFAAVLDGQFDDGVLGCYEAASTLMVDETPVPHDQQQFEEASPFLWSPTHPEYDAFVATQLRTMASDGFFDGASGVEVLVSDSDVTRRAVDEVVQPFLAQQGVSRLQVSYVDPTNAGTLGDTTSAAVAAGSSAGLDRVLVVGGTDVLPFALTSQAAVGYGARWGVSTFDSPQLLQDNPGSIVSSGLDGMVGLGYAPTYDVGATAGPPFPDPSRPAEAVCKGILDSAGIDVGDGQRPSYRTVFQYCDATFFLKAALDRAPRGAVTGAEFKDAVGQIGQAYASASTFGSELLPGQYAATDAGRVLAYDAPCACFQYEGGNVAITSR